jgi:hypothetical protein
LSLDRKIASAEISAVGSMLALGNIAPLFQVNVATRGRKRVERGKLMAVSIMTTEPALLRTRKA